MSKKVWNNPEISILGLKSTKQPQPRPYIGCNYCDEKFGSWGTAVWHEFEVHKNGQEQS